MAHILGFHSYFYRDVNNYSVPLNLPAENITVNGMQSSIIFELISNVNIHSTKSS